MLFDKKLIIVVSAGERIRESQVIDFPSVITKLKPDMGKEGKNVECTDVGVKIRKFCKGSIALSPL